MSETGRVAEHFSSPWRKIGEALLRWGSNVKYWWYRDSGFDQRTLEELCHIDNMADFRAVSAAASGYYLPARYLFNEDGTPKHRTEICTQARELMDRLQKDVSTKGSRYRNDFVKVGYWTSENRSIILSIWYWFFFNSGDKDKTKRINRMIHDTYREWEEVMAQDVDYETEKTEKALGKAVCEKCAGHDIDINDLRALILEEFPNIDSLAFMDPYGQLLGPAGICKSMALVVTAMKKNRATASDVKSSRF